MSIKQVMKEVVESGRIKILPDHEEKKYFHWIENLRDWCISRQIWWGHRVPVWYRGRDEMYAGHRRPQGEGWTQDTDTLDTWFSSALWTWSTLIDPETAKDENLSLAEILERSPDYRRFHPTSVMETGYDIMFFWVARMILMTTYVTNDIPFSTVYLHGLVLDKDGEKMAKTKPETCIDPLDEIRENGADALRLAMILGGAVGRDMKLGRDHITACKRLVNKIWNAAKLVSRSIEGKTIGDLPPAPITHPVNRWMLVRLKNLIESANDRLENYSLGEAGEQIRASFWGEFCDFYLEAIKVEELARLSETPATLLHVFDQYLRLFHPFMPFVTEEIWTEMKRPGTLIRAEWPRVREDHHWPESSDGVDAVVRLISEIRRIRSDRGIEARARVNAEVQPRAHLEVMESCREIIARLARTNVISFDGASTTSRKDASVGVDEAFSVAVSLDRADTQAERARLTKQLNSEQEKLAALEKRLSNEGFVNRAKPEVVEATRQEAAAASATIASIEERLRALD
ncbi:MAG: class I tRNA ligase family protein, partial [Acidobacteriota bacterium]